MKIKELIKELKQFNPNAEVCVITPDGGSLPIDICWNADDGIFNLKTTKLKKKKTDKVCFNTGLPEVKITKS